MKLNFINSIKGLTWLDIKKIIISKKEKNLKGMEIGINTGIKLLNIIITKDTVIKGGQNYVQHIYTI